MGKKIYSVCITNYNSIDTIRSSLESILSLLDDSFEVIVCDNYSNDGSRQVLEEYALKGRITLIVEHCSRGKGRQTAFESSQGKYIISGIDTDDRMTPDLHKFLEEYHKYHEW